jgi:hypothetical protein
MGLACDVDYTSRVCLSYSPSGAETQQSNLAPLVQTDYPFLPLNHKGVVKEDRPAILAGDKFDASLMTIMV